jgi:hypothetical protein
MSFILLAAVCAAAAAAAGAFAGRRSAVNESEPDADKKNATPVEAPAARAFANDALSLDVGDVVSVGTEERWLAGALALRDGEHLVAALFIAPEGKRNDAVCAFSSPRRELLWLTPHAVEIGAEPPSAIELDGIVMRRRARVPVTVARYGQDTPDVGEQAVFAEYEAGGGATGVVIRGANAAWGWSGKRVDEGAYDRMGKGEA